MLINALERPRWVVVLAWVRCSGEAESAWEDLDEATEIVTKGGEAVALTVHVMDSWSPWAMDEAAIAAFDGIDIRPMRQGRQISPKRHIPSE